MKSMVIFLNDGMYKIFYTTAKHAIIPSSILCQINTQWRYQFITLEQNIKFRTRESAEVAVLHYFSFLSNIKSKSELSILLDNTS